MAQQGEELNINNIVVTCQIRQDYVRKNQCSSDLPIQTHRIKLEVINLLGKESQDLGIYLGQFHIAPADLELAWQRQP